MDPEAEPLNEPAPPRGNSHFVVLMSGVATSALTLAGVYWLNKNTDDFHIMGWYANYVIPAGAMIVGIAAGSGYGIASWLTGARISRGLLIPVLILQTAAYFTAEYIEYRDVMNRFAQQGLVLDQQPGFVRYYDFKARNFAWKNKNQGQGAGQPLGGWGYVFVLLGAAGFILSGLIAPAVLYAVPYCDSCQRYMSTKVLGVLPASVPAKKITKKDTAAQEEHNKEQEQAALKADEAVARLQAAISAGRVDTVHQELLAAGAAKANEKLPKRIRVSLTWCRRCQEGRIRAMAVMGVGDQVQEVQLAETPVAPDFVRALEQQEQS